MVSRSTALLSLGAAWDHATWNIPLKFPQPDESLGSTNHFGIEPGLPDIQDLGGPSYVPEEPLEITNHFGIELGFADILALRYGYVPDPEFKGFPFSWVRSAEFGLPDGHSLGVGAGVHVFDWFEVRYDFASVEHAWHLWRHHHAIFFSLDGIGISRAMGR